MDLRRVALRDISCGFRSVRPILFLCLSWGSIRCRCRCRMWQVARRGGRVVYVLLVPRLRVRLFLLGVRQSMGAVGTSADNALAESFNATLKREVLRDRKVFDSPISCRQEVFRWCMRYNTRRRHSWCKLLAPDTFEALTSATLTQAA